LVAAHALLAKTASRLVAVQLEDLAGMKEQANLPGTTNEHPNWRRKLPIDLENIVESELFRDIVGAVSRERPRLP
jgi:4-alpha-glucanotransferase